MTCIIVNCDKPARAWKMCTRHYQQVRKHGSITSLEPSRFEPRPAIVDGHTARISLGINAKDGYAIVDVADAWLDKYAWYKNTYGYAATGGKNVLMHRLMTSAEPGFDVDHRDQDRLNNRRSNLRICTRAQNLLNKGKLSTNTTNFKGVCYDKQRRKFVATINGKYVGRYDTAELAAVAYNAKAIELHGDFASLNDMTTINTTRTQAT